MKTSWESRHCSRYIEELKEGKPFVKCICPHCKRIVLLREEEINKML